MSLDVLYLREIYTLLVVEISTIQTITRLSLTLDKIKVHEIIFMHYNNFFFPFKSCPSNIIALLGCFRMIILGRCGYLFELFFP